MSVRDVPPDEVPSGDGSRTAPEGTPFAVDVSRDRRARFALAMFVAGPVIWSVHFLLVYLVAEAATSGVNAVASFDKTIERVPTVRRAERRAVARLRHPARRRVEHQQERAQPVGHKTE